jgi:hypothetical protein
MTRGPENKRVKGKPKKENQLGTEQENEQKTAKFFICCYLNIPVYLPIFSDVRLD